MKARTIFKERVFVLNYTKLHNPHHWDNVNDFNGQSH